MPRPTKSKPPERWLPKTTLIRDALYNTSNQSGSSPEYAKGVVLGVVSTLMAAGCDYDTAIKFVSRHLPHGVTNDRVPKDWLVDLEMMPPSEPSSGEKGA